MKLQHLAIIFVIIILPITIILSVYTDHQIKVINYQAQYSSYLLNASYDAIKAFQLNTINNKYCNKNILYPCAKSFNKFKRKN